MSNKPEQSFFGKDHAASYDQRWLKLESINRALHLLSKIVLSNLPDDANVLCVGAGTGSELIALAQDNPGWKFMAVDTSAAMLDVCRQKVQDAGIVSRCDFHEGPIDSLPRYTVFDVATSILVSQFLTDVHERRDFFREILSRLRLGAYVINADLAFPNNPSVSEALMESWIKMQIYTGVPEDAAKATASQWGKAVAVLKPQEIEAILVSGGFENPTLFYQALFIHAWYAQVPVA